VTHGTAALAHVLELDVAGRWRQWISWLPLFHL
jgi:hypothetical protein